MAKKPDVSRLIAEQIASLTDELREIDSRRAAITEQLSALESLITDPRLRVVFGSSISTGPLALSDQSVDVSVVHDVSNDGDHKQAHERGVSESSPGDTLPLGEADASEAGVSEIPTVMPTSGLREAALEALRTEGAPLHVSLLILRIEAMGIEIRGKSKRNTLVGTIFKDGRFRNYGGNVWGLTEWDTARGEVTPADGVGAA